jgi:hypothetical protein
VKGKKHPKSWGFFELLTPHFPLLTSHFPLPTSHFSLLTSHFSLLTSHFPLPNVPPGDYVATVVAVNSAGMSTESGGVVVSVR